jgi:hypothetical protein
LNIYRLLRHSHLLEQAKHSAVVNADPSTTNRQYWQVATHPYDK